MREGLLLLSFQNQGVPFITFLKKENNKLSVREGIHPPFFHVTTKEVSDSLHRMDFKKYKDLISKINQERKLDSEE